MRDSATYFNKTERRIALLRWMRKYQGLHSVNEIVLEAVDIFTPLYDLDQNSTARTDLYSLIRDGSVIVHKRRGAADQFEAAS